MNKIETKEWKYFLLGELFTEIYKGEANVKGELNIAAYPIHDTIPFISRTDKKNGCDGFVLDVLDMKFEKGNALIIGDTTSTCFYQEEDFITGDHIVICRAPWLNKYTGLFVKTILEKDRYRYSYGRAFKMDLIKRTSIKLPANFNVPDWNYIEKYIKSLWGGPHVTSITSSEIKFNFDNWEEFELGNLFQIKKGKRLTAADQTIGDTIYIGAIDSNNGIANYIGQSPIHEKNTITLSYNGSVGEAFFQEKDYWATDDVNVLYFRKENNYNFNKFIAMFICTVLRSEKYRFSYGRKWTLDNMKKTVIKLPAKNHKPDWLYMEKYIKSLPYSDKI